MKIQNRLLKYLAAALGSILLAGMIFIQIKDSNTHSTLKPLLEPIPLSPPTPSLEVISKINKIKNKVNLKTQWLQFQSHFGNELKAEFSKSGRLVSVTGKFGQGTFAKNDFRPDEPEKIIARAKEILHAAHSLMQIQDGWSLENPVVHGSKISAQAFFNETYRGLMVLPEGSVKIDLGPKGELIGLYSNYSPEVKIINQIRINSDEAQNQASLAFQQSNQTSTHIEGGTKIIWVNGHVGRYSYQFIVNGRQVIVDADSGKIIFTKDIRRY